MDTFDFELALLSEDAPYSGGTTPASRLVRAVADLYTTMYLSQAAHWNVQGPDFVQLHALFKESYEMAYGAIDDVAEQVRILGVLMPRALPDLLATSSAPLPAADESPEAYIDCLARAHTMLKDKWDDIAQTSERDAGLNDLAGRLSGEHAKMAWKLRTTLRKVGSTSSTA